MPDRFPSSVANTTLCARCDRRPHVAYRSADGAEVFEECVGCEAICCHGCMTECETCLDPWCRQCLDDRPFYEGICVNCCDRVDGILEEE